MNCFKAGVGCQTCGAIRNKTPWVGAATDSGYNEGEGYMAEQKKFQEKDRVYDRRAGARAGEGE